MEFRSKAEIVRLSIITEQDFMMFRDYARVNNLNPLDYNVQTTCGGLLISSMPGASDRQILNLLRACGGEQKTRLSRLVVTRLVKSVHWPEPTTPMYNLISKFETVMDSRKRPLAKTQQGSGIEYGLRTAPVQVKIHIAECKNRTSEVWVQFQLRAIWAKLAWLDAQGQGAGSDTMSLEYWLQTVWHKCVNTLIGENWFNQEFFTSNVYQPRIAEKEPMDIHLYAEKAAKKLAGHYNRTGENLLNEFENTFKLSLDSTS
jgi:hypothetical protein